MNTRSLSYLILTLAAAGAAGCSQTNPIERPGGGGAGVDDDDDDKCAGGACIPVPPPDTPESIVAVREALTTSCAPCHSGRAGIAREGFGTIFDVADMVNNGLLVPGDPDGSRLWQRIERDEMPGDQAVDPLDPTRRIDKVSDKNKAIIRAWIANGAPSLRAENRPPIASSTYLSALRDDLRDVNPAEVINTRYISLHTYYNSPDIPQGELDAAVNAVSKLLNHLSPRQRAVVPPQQVIEPGGNTIALRVNLKDYDLSAADWARIENAAEVIDRSTPCDVPMINADQFLAIASTDQHERTDGTLESVYSNIVVAKLLVDAGLLEEGVDVFEAVPGVGGGRGAAFLTSRFTMLDLATALKIDLPANIKNPNRDVTVRACTQKSGVSEAIRCIERDAIGDRDRGFWWSMDFLDKAGLDELADPFVTPIGPANGGLAASFEGEKQFTIAGGEAFWNWPNQMVGYALYNGGLNLLSVAPQDAVTHPANTENARAVENAVSCFDCHSSHILPMQDLMRPVAELNRELSATERGFIEELFPGQEFLDGRYKIDTDNFVDELRKVYVKQGASGQLPDSIFSLNKVYEYDLTMAGVAAALFSNPEEIAEQVRRNDNLQRLGPALALVENGFINRQNFVASFRELRENIGPNDELVQFCVQRRAAGVSAEDEGEDPSGDGEGAAAEAP